MRPASTALETLAGGAARALQRRARRGADRLQSIADAYFNIEHCYFNVEVAIHVVLQALLFVVSTLEQQSAMFYKLYYCCSFQC